MRTNPADYVFAGVMTAIYRISPSKSVKHSLNIQAIKDAFIKYTGIVLSDNQINYLIRRMENVGVLNVVVDPYADTLLETSDSQISEYMESNASEILSRAWSTEDWLKSALNNPKLWDDFSSTLDGIEVVEAIPSADGFVTINHNSGEYIEAEAAVVAADEALRGDNEFQDNEQKTWIRIHIETGISLIKKGGPVLRGALISLIVEPLKAAVKATTNENVRKLIAIALTAFLKWLGL